MAFCFESTYLLSPKKKKKSNKKHEYTRWKKNTLLLLWKLLAHNHANVQKSQPKIPPFVTQPTVSKACCSVCLERSYSLPYWKYNTD